ncbi:hypothetical protein IQ07DRAFT_599057 [Pyrenochaeta sp. DS3sAY3a]|nr:hypothetical protein IQ07DRAFT_599057 [Pyrenochaeta sp. DS3sAY3a]
MSSDSDSQTQAALTANKLASVAVGFSIAAFLIAYLQLFMGNLMSGNALWKTNQAAIGGLARHRSWRPSLRRIKILYPKISLQPEHLLQAARNSTQVQTSQLFFKKRDRAVKKYVSHDRPRATWAQIVQAMGITDPSSIVEDYLDSDTIPSGIDVPIQRARYFHLGQLALYIGCDTVSLDVSARELHATGDHCSMTTEVVPTFGKVVRFEGNITALQDMSIGVHDPVTAMIMECMCQGQFLLAVPIEEAKEFRIHPDILRHCLAEKLTCREYYTSCQSVWPSDSVELENLHGSFADEMKTFSMIRESEAYIQARTLFSKWQQAFEATRPTVMIIGTMAVIPGTFIGYPNGLFLNAFLTWFTTEAKDALQLDQEFDMADRVISPSSVVSRELQQLAFDPQFSLYNHPKEMPFLGKQPGYSWLTTRLHEQYTALPENVRQVLSSSKPSLHPVHNVRVLIMPWTLELLKNFQPTDWVKSLRARSQNTRRADISPCRLLWVQLILLDISIRLEIKGSPERMDGHKSGKIRELQDMELEQNLSDVMIAEGPSMIAAITDSQMKHRPGREPMHEKADQSRKGQFYAWGLKGPLAKNCTFFENLRVADPELEYRRLALMLKLRALFFIAFLMVGPDSTQVYEARNSSAEARII